MPDLRAIFDPSTYPDVTVLPIGLFKHPDVREIGTMLLSVISRSVDDVNSVSDAEEIVKAFKKVRPPGHGVSARKVRQALPQKLKKKVRERERITIDA